MEHEPRRLRSVPEPASRRIDPEDDLLSLCELYLTLRGRLDVVAGKIEARTGKYPEDFLAAARQLFAPEEDRPA